MSNCEALAEPRHLKSNLLSAGGLINSSRNRAFESESYADRITLTVDRRHVPIETFRVRALRFWRSNAVNDVTED